MLHLDTGNTGFMLLCTALVMFMTPGLAFFYGGLVGRKNVLTIMMQRFVSAATSTALSATLTWPFCAASLQTRHRRSTTRSRRRSSSRTS
jgi:ammonium transporter, Amt family